MLSDLKYTLRMLVKVPGFPAIAILPLALIVSSTSAIGSEVLEDIVERTIPLGLAGTFALHGTDGTIQIYGTNSSDIKIVAIKKAFSPIRLKAMKIQIEAKDGLVNVNTDAPAKPRWAWSDRSGTVDYIINIPQTARIVAVDLPNGELMIDGMRGAPISGSVGNGRLTTHNCFCDQKVRVESGGVDIVFDWLEEKPVRIEAAVDDGNARALIPADASFEVRALAEHGRVASDFSEIENRKRGGVSEINETIGQAPLSKLTMRAVNGNVRISEVIW
jgi:hypothetical protein